MAQVQEKINKRLLEGKVVSDKMDKTIVVLVERTFMDPKFAKISRMQKKYKVHDENEDASLGDVVEFYSGRPCSKQKHMYLSRVIKKAKDSAQ